MLLTTPATQTSPLLRLPAELRNTIYTLALSKRSGFKHWIDNHTGCFLNLFPPLLEACSQIHLEAGTIYCATVPFSYHDIANLVKFFAALSTPYRQAIRVLEYATTFRMSEHVALRVLKERHGILSLYPFERDLREVVWQARRVGPHSKIVSYRPHGTV